MRTSVITGLAAPLLVIVGDVTQTPLNVMAGLRRPERRCHYRHFAGAESLSQAGSDGACRPFRAMGLVTCRSKARVSADTGAARSPGIRRPFACTISTSAA
jgi:hypothetical protein